MTQLNLDLFAFVILKMNSRLYKHSLTSQCEVSANTPNQCKNTGQNLTAYKLEKVNNRKDQFNATSHTLYNEKIINFD